MAYSANEQRYDAMTYRRCGSTGLKLPLLSLGLWHNFGTNDDYGNMKRMCFAAFDRGVTHFDLANNYGPLAGSAEENFGRILREELSAYRDELIVSTKAGYYMWPGPYGDWGSRKYMLASLDQSLKRLGLPYVDVFYHHRMDKETPLEESMLALNTAVKSGRALYAGISNYDSATARKAAAMLKEMRCPFVLNQVRYSIFDRHIEPDGLEQAAAEAGFGIIAFSPLAQGLLTDRYLGGVPENSRIGKGGPFLKRDQLTEARLGQIRALNELAKNRGQSLSELALSWVLRGERVTSVLVGASSPEQIVQNLGILNAPLLTADELARIDAITAAAN
ncbi:MAG: L-glyceraldehyde 3-phosphate reductase [Clostridiales bacterium]|nr:L-glyceraldehyde 3-phosphate reductase [Clostridiales bacterium]